MCEFAGRSTQPEPSHASQSQPESGRAVSQPAMPNSAAVQTHVPLGRACARHPPPGHDGAAQSFHSADDGAQARFGPRRAVAQSPRPAGAPQVFGRVGEVAGEIDYHSSCSLVSGGNLQLAERASSGPRAPAWKVRRPPTSSLPISVARSGSRASSLKSTTGERSGRLARFSQSRACLDLPNAPRTRAPDSCRAGRRRARARTWRRARGPSACRARPRARWRRPTPRGRRSVPVARASSRASLASGGNPRSPSRRPIGSPPPRARGRPSWRARSTDPRAVACAPRHRHGEPVGLHPLGGENSVAAHADSAAGRRRAARESLKSTAGVGPTSPAGRRAPRCAPRAARRRAGRPPRGGSSRCGSRSGRGPRRARVGWCRGGRRGQPAAAGGAEAEVASTSTRPASASKPRSSPSPSAR